jgi:integrase
LVVRKNAANAITRSWIFRYQIGANKSRKTTDLGLGPAHTVGLKEAREKARAFRLMLLDGIDPKQARNEERARKRAEAARALTFRQAAERYMADHCAKWVPRHYDGWIGSLRDYAYPAIGDKPVDRITTDDILAMLGPIWQTKTVTASNLRGRVERILAWCAVRGHRPADQPNVALWKGHLREALPAPRSIAKIKPMASLPVQQMPGLVARLGEIEDNMVAIAIAFAAHTAVRSHDIRNARREHIDREARLWTIPAFSKTGKEQRVPLTDAALALVDRAIALADSTDAGRSGRLFPNPMTGAELAQNVPSKLLTKLGLGGTATLHGFRSAFRSWAAEAGAEHVVAELALGHTVGSAVERAYQRSDLLRRRTALMQQWSSFLSGETATAEVVTIGAKRKRG